MKNTIDLSLIKSEVSGDPVFINELLIIFSENIVEYSNQVNEHLANENIVGVKEVTHKLAPMCDMLGLKSIYKLLKKIEANCDAVFSVSQLSQDVLESVGHLQSVLHKIDKRIENNE